MSTAFAHSGAILDDQMTGFQQVVNQLDEGKHGVTKDVIPVTASITLDAEVHHGKVLDIKPANAATVVTVTLPKDGAADYPPVGFSCTIMSSVASLTNGFVVAIGDSVSKFVGAINGVSNGNNTTTATCATCAQYETELKLEAVHDGTNYFFRCDGSSVAAVSFS